MTVIACKVLDNMICIASDSQITKGDRIIPGINFPKVRRIGEAYVGGSGRCDEVGLFFKYVEGRAIPTEACGIVQYMAEFYRWRDSLSEWIKPSPEDKSESNNHYIVVIRGRVFVIGGLVCFELKHGAIYSTGSGEELALGAMAYGATVQEAVEIACRYDINCSEPIEYFEIDRIKEG